MFSLQGSRVLGPHDMPRGLTPGGARVFYVNCRDGVGLDTHEGTDPQFPLKTLEAAYLKCTTNKGDWIFAQDFWEASAAPLTIDKKDIHIIALGSGNFDDGNDIEGAAAAAIEIEDGGGDSEIAGFNLGADDVALTIGEAGRVHIHHCTFGCNIGCVTGRAAMVGGGSFTHSSIHDCLFGSLLSGTAIIVPLNTSMILDNIFHNPEASITPVSIFQHCIILRNTFKVPDSANGEAINQNIAGGYYNLIDKNTAIYGNAQVGYSHNPFRDVGTTKSHWGRNYRGNQLIEPVTV